MLSKVFLDLLPVSKITNAILSFRFYIFGGNGMGVLIKMASTKIEITYTIIQS